MNRRSLLVGLGGVVGSGVLAGCADVVPGSDGTDEEVPEFWEEWDDYPEDDDRNRQVVGTSSEFERVEAPLLMESMLGDASERDSYEYTYDVVVEPVEDVRIDVYISPEIPDGEEYDLNDPDVFEYLPEYSERNMARYENTFVVPDGEVWYLHVFKSGDDPSYIGGFGTENVMIDLMIDGYYYNSFEDMQERVEEESG